MKIRSGFVSNSSSASFIVEVKGECKEIFNVLYENLDAFKTEGCKELLEKKLKFHKEFKTPKEDDSESKKNMFKYDVQELEDKIKNLEDYKELSWREINKIEEGKEKQLIKYRQNKHKEETVKDSLSALKWHVSIIDDGYVSFNVGGPICYSGWGNISHRKELLELVAFFTFMKYDIRTRIESHEGSF